jgi:hypothetical protein
MVRADAWGWTFCWVAAVLRFSRSTQTVPLFSKRYILASMDWINLSFNSVGRPYCCRMACTSTDGTSTAAAVEGLGWLVASTGLPWL